MSVASATLVLDASVLLDWALKEGHATQADALLSDHEDAALAGPAHWRAEVSNALFQRTRRTTSLQLSAADADGALTDILNLGIVTVDPDDLYSRTITFARTYGLVSLYDALYVTLADRLGAEFWTGDQQLLAALAAAAPWVRDIRQYPLPAGP